MAFARARYVMRPDNEPGQNYHLTSNLTVLLKRRLDVAQVALLGARHAVRCETKSTQTTHL